MRHRTADHPASRVAERGCGGYAGPVPPRSTLRFLAVLVLALVIGCATGGLPRKGWTHYRVGEVDFYSGSTPSRTEALLDGFTQFRIVTARLTSASSVEPQWPTRVYLFPDHGSYERHVQSKNSGGRFVARDGTFTIALDARQASGVPELLLHEYTHLIVANSGGAGYPAWYSEGYAELMSTVRVVGSDVQVGRVPSHDVQAAADFARWLPLEELFAGDIFAVRGDPERLHRAYAQAWLVVHYLRIGEPAFTPRLDAYLEGVSAGADPVASAPGTLGLPLHELEKRLRDYIRAQNLTYQLMPADQFGFPEMKHVGTPLTPGATAARLAELCWAMDNRELAGALARSAAAAGEPDPLAGSSR